MTDLKNVPATFSFLLAKYELLEEGQVSRCWLVTCHDGRPSIKTHRSLPKVTRHWLVAAVNFQPCFSLHVYWIPGVCKVYQVTLLMLKLEWNMSQVLQFSYESKITRHQLWFSWHNLSHFKILHDLQTPGNIHNYLLAALITEQDWVQQAQIYVVFCFKFID